MPPTAYEQFTDEILNVLSPEQRAAVEKEHGDGTCAATDLRLMQVRELERGEDIAKGADGMWASFRCSRCGHFLWLQLSSGREEAA